MKHIAFILFGLFLMGNISFAQQIASTDTVNQKDRWGRKQGYWIYKNHKTLDDLFPYTLYGYYTDDRKNGPWVKTDSYGQLKSIENYYKDVLDGLCKYYEKGRLTLECHYRAVDPDLEQDTISVFDPESLMEEDTVIVPGNKGSLKHGLWKYYDPISGKLLKTEIYQVDSLIRTKEMYVEGYSINDPNYKKKIEEKLPHNIDPSGHKYQKGKIRRSLIK